MRPVQMIRKLMGLDRAEKDNKAILDHLGKPQAQQELQELQEFPRHKRQIPTLEIVNFLEFVPDAEDESLIWIVFTGSSHNLTIPMLKSSLSYLFQCTADEIVGMIQEGQEGSESREMGNNIFQHVGNGTVH